MSEAPSPPPSGVSSNDGGPLSIRHPLRDLWAQWKLREQFLLPVITSLTTAAILFTVAAVFAPTIRRLFASPGVTGFPLYCVVEPYNGPLSDTVLVDLYIVNLAPTELTAATLAAQASKAAAEQGLSPDVIAIANHPFVDSIVRVDSLPDENRGKVGIEIHRVGPREYHLAVHSMAPSAVARFTIVTNMVAAISARSNRASNPIQCETLYRYSP